MKRLSYYIISIIIFFFTESCSYHNKDNTIQILSMERDSIENLLHERDSMVYSMNGYIEVIASSIDSIKSAEQIYTITRDIEGNALSKDVIKENLNLLESIIRRQRNRIVELDSILMITRDSLDYYRQLIQYLYVQIDKKDEEIRQMRQDIEQKDRTIRTLTSKVNTMTKSLNDAEVLVKDQSETIDLQSNIIELDQQLANTGYVLIAKRKELQSLGVLSRGLRKTINFDNINPSLFEQIDMRDFHELSINCSSASVLSSMPSDSYELTKSNDCVILRIKDPGKFWSVTTFLIVQIQ